MLEQDLTCEIVDTEKQLGIFFGGGKKHSKGFTFAFFNQTMTDQIFDQPIEVCGVPKLDQAHMPLLSLGFQAAAPVLTEVSTDIRMNGLVECIGKAVEAHRYCLGCRAPTNLRALGLATAIEFARRAPVGVKWQPKMTFWRDGQSAINKVL